MDAFDASAEAKNCGAYNSIPPYVLMERYLISSVQGQLNLSCLLILAHYKRNSAEEGVCVDTSKLKETF
jgi:hypothetical protein